MINLDMIAPGQPLRILVERLERHGVQLAELDEYRTTRAFLEGPVPPMPSPRVLGADAEELHRVAYERAVFRVITGKGDAYADARHALLRQLEAEATAALRDRADAILGQLRPRFDRAADALRAAATVGVTPEDTVESLFDESDAKRSAFRTIGPAGRNLDELLTTRQVMTYTLGIPPNPVIGAGQYGGASGIDWNLTVCPGASLDAYDARNPGRRWLAVADALNLAPVVELSPYERIAQTDPSLAGRLRAEAARRTEAA